MGSFVTGNTAAASAPVADASWKADGFVNMTLALPGQVPVKLPSLALKKDKFGALIDWLAQDPANVQKLLPHIVLDYKSAQPTAKVLDFSTL